jgi:hypothetical protein
LANTVPSTAPPDGLEWVKNPVPDAPLTVVQKDLADTAHAGHHDPQKLTSALMELLGRQRTVFRG